MNKLILAVVAGAILSASPASAAVNLLKNGSFENGLDDWVLGGDVDVNGQPLNEPPVVITYNFAAPYPAGAHGEAVPAPTGTDNPFFADPGSKGLYFVADAPNPNQTLSQTVSTVAGWYQVGFDWYLPQNGFNNPGNAQLQAFVDNQLIATFVASGGPATTWQHTFKKLYLPSSNNVTFVFSYTASTFPAKDFVLDRAYLAQVPEPATWAMMIGGFGLIGAAARRRKAPTVTFA